jgi:NitT/TauT family transport system substrate-binding protein
MEEEIPRRRRRGWALAVLALVLAAGAAALLAAALRRPAASAPAEPLRIAASSTPHAALLHLAAAKGFYAAEGLDVTLVPVSHGKAALDLLDRNQVELAAAAEVPFVIAVLQGQPLDVVASIASISTEMAVVARRDRAIDTPEALQGRTVGVPFGTSGEYFLWAFLTRHKLTPEAVRLVDVPPGQIPSQLARGSIDAASTWQPVRFGAESALGAEAITFTDPDAYTVTHVLIGRHDHLLARHSAVQKLLRALLRAEAFCREHPDEALALLAERLKIAPSALQPVWGDLRLAVDLRQSQLVTLEDEARWAMARGHAPRGPMPNFLPRLSLDALLAVRPERVTVVH